MSPNGIIFFQVNISNPKNFGGSDSGTAASVAALHILQSKKIN